MQHRVRGVNLELADLILRMHNRRRQLLRVVFFALLNGGALFKSQWCGAHGALCGKRVLLELERLVYAAMGNSVSLRRRQINNRRN